MHVVEDRADSKTSYPVMYHFVRLSGIPSGYYSIPSLGAARIRVV